ncbi:Protein arginine methyltransferase NDUFAF7 [Aphelenchoides fujianensis]|nr:Protein arginine methyltransferase NDUFAF7 [Aphelenchoides fujianensis]
MLRRLLTNSQLRALRRFSSTADPAGGFPADGLLERFVRDRIRSSGPITVHEFMTLAARSAAGYYSQAPKTSEIIGAKGDFVTSPELSQAFGEIIGVWIYNELANCGQRGEWQLVELGPGTGTLMRDILRTLHTLKVRKEDVVHEERMSVHLVEASDSLIDAQELALRQRPSGEQRHVRHNRTTGGIPVYWHHTLDSVPHAFSVFVANEFLDALPIHVFEREDAKWREVYVALDSEEKLCFMASKGENLHTKGLIPPWIRDDPDRTKWEVCPQAGAIITDIAQRITIMGGFGLFVDYGHDGSRKTTSLRAYHKHQLVDPLRTPGLVDVTADVDFGYLRRILDRICLTFGPIEQRYFLAQMGIRLRIERLLQQTADAEQRGHILRAYSLLMGGGSDEMGARFKAFALFPSTLGGNPREARRLPGRLLSGGRGGERGGDEAPGRQ